MSAFKFDVQYQGAILALMVQDYVFLGLASNYLEPAHFDTEPLSWFYVTIRDYYLDYQARPTKEYLRREAKKHVNKGKSKKKKIADEFKKVFIRLWKKVPDKDYLIEEVRSFVRHQAIKNAMIMSVPLLKKERYDEIAGVFDEALNVGSVGLDLGTSYFKDARERILNRRKERLVVATGIPELDQYLAYHGIAEKELALVLAPPSVGKTMCLQHLAKTSVVRKHNTAVYTLEMSEDAWSERLDTSWSGVSMRVDKPNYGKVFRRLRSIEKKYGSPLVIKEFPTSGATVNTIRAHLQHLYAVEGWVPDLVIVDYAELLNAIKTRRETRHEIGEVVKELRGLAVELGIPIWSAVQANRKALSKRTITIEDLSESFEPAKHADVIIALCQTEEEFEDGIMRVFIAKNRNFISKITIEIQTDFKRQQFYVPMAA